MTTPAAVAHRPRPRPGQALADVLVALAAIAGRVARSPFADDVRDGLDYTLKVLGAVAAVWLVVEVLALVLPIFRPLGEFLALEAAKAGTR